VCKASQEHEGLQRGTTENSLEEVRVRRTLTSGASVINYTKVMFAFRGAY
jgi:hypothetical protein